MKRLLLTTIACAISMSGLYAAEMPDKMGAEKVASDKMSAESTSTNMDEKGIAVQGYDVVAFFTESKPVTGNEKFTAKHEGATYHFSSEKNRDTFAAEPAKYVPQYGGYCAYGVAKGAKFPIQIETWQIVDGRLILNKNPEVKVLFDKDLKANVKLADEKWPTVAKS